MFRLRNEGAEPLKDKEATWTRADLDRLIAGDKRTWDRAVAMMEGLIDDVTRSWTLSTLESDAVREHVQDVLLVGDMRRLREFRDAGSFPAYLARVTTNRARGVASRRGEVVRDFDETAAKAPRLVADIRSSVAGLRSPVAIGRVLLGLRHALSPTQFRILWLRHVERLSTRDTAGALRVTRQAVRKGHDSAVMAILRERSRPDELRGTSREEIPPADRLPPYVKKSAAERPQVAPPPLLGRWVRSGAHPRREQDGRVDVPQVVSVNVV